MIVRPTRIVATLCLLGLVTLPVYAEPSAKKVDKAQLINQLTERTESLEQQLQQLQAELKALKAEKNKVAANSHPADPPAPVKRTRVRSRAGFVYSVRKHKFYTTTPPVSAPKAAPAAIPKEEVTEAPFGMLPYVRYILGGLPVVTSPYLGERSEFDGTDLISSLPTINEGLHLLKERQRIHDALEKIGQHEPNEPFVDLSGSMQPFVFLTKPYNHGPVSSDIDINAANIQVMGNINPWVTTFMDIEFDSNPPGEGSLGPRLSNSRLFVNQAFASVGNLNKSPIYAVMGQMFVPFGRYSTAMISDPLTKNLGRVQARAFLLGYNKIFKLNPCCDHPTLEVGAQAFTFRGDTRTSVTSRKINQYGGNLDFKLAYEKWSFYFGGSYIANMADSASMQRTGGGEDFFRGFSEREPDNSEVLVHRVPAADIHGNLTIGPVSIVGEYLSAVREFDCRNLTFNRHGAKPRASNIEAVYNFELFARPSNIAAGYQQTSQALALLLPRRRYIATFNTSIWKDTIQSLEYRHDINYGKCDRATGQRLPADVDDNLGRSNDMITFQFAAYF